MLLAEEEKKMPFSTGNGLHGNRESTFSEMFIALRVKTSFLPDARAQTRQAKCFPVRNAVVGPCSAEFGVIVVIGLV